MRDLAFVTEIEPAAGEEPLAFQLVNLTVGKDAAIDETAFRIDKRPNLHAALLQGSTFLI